MAGADVSIKGICVATAGEVLWGNVVDLEMGDTGVSKGGDMGGGSVMATIEGVRLVRVSVCMQRMSRQCLGAGYRSRRL